MKFLALGLLLALTAVRLWLAASNPVTPPEAYYWMCAIQPDWAYFDGPGGTAALVRAGSDLLGNSPLGLRFAFPLAALVASLGAYLLGRNLFGPAAGLLAAALLNALPFFNLAALHADPTLPALAALLFAAWAGWRAVDRNRDSISWILAAVAIGIGALFRYEVLLAWPALLAVCCASPRYRVQFRHPGLYLAVLLTVAFCLPAITWNSQNNWAPLALGTLRTAFTLDFAALPAIFPDLHDTLSLVVALLLFAALFLAASQSRHHLRPRFILAWATPFLLLWLYRALHASTDSTSLLFAAALLIPFAIHLADDRPILRILLPVVTLLAALLSATALTLPAWHRNPWARGENALPWPEIAAVIDTLRDEAHQTHPEAVFFIAKNPAYTAALNYHLPRVAPGQPREIFLRESQDLSTQFGLWPRYDDFVETTEAPDEFFAELRAVNPYVGRSALYITDETTLPQTITGPFLRVTPAASLELLDATGAPRTLHFYFCEEYQTMPL